MEESTQSSTIETHADFKIRLDSIRIGKEQVGDRWVRRPAHLVNRDVWEESLRHLRSRGKFFQAPHAYYIDEDEHLLMLTSAKPDRDFSLLLRRMGLLAGEPHTRLVAENMSNFALRSPIRRVHRISFMSDTTGYIYASPTRMFKVSAETIESVPVGTDGVVLIAEDIGDWPSLSDLQPHLDAMRSVIGGTCTRLLPGLPLTDLLTSRFSGQSVLTAEQAHQMFLTRIMFLSAASKYSLWPLVLHTGDQNSGKSTPFELLLTMMTGEPGLIKSMPTRERDLIASITNSSICAYDNIDGVDFEAAERRALSDYICHISTGAKIEMAKLYENNIRLEYEMRNHGLFSARVNPFSRSDVMRRTIHVEMDPPGGKRIDKDTLKARVLEQRPRMLAEYLLRVQNIVRAHAEFGAKTYCYESEMAEYEAFTLRCADYEGTIDETVALWRRYMSQYRQSITERNPIVHAVRLWLGSGPNAGRQVSPTTLFSELQTVYHMCGLQFVYKSPSAFGKHIASHLPPLRVIGYSEVQTRNNKDYVFAPGLEELEACKHLFRDASAAALNRSTNALNRERPMDMQEDDTSDLESSSYKKGLLQ